MTLRNYLSLMPNGLSLAVLGGLVVASVGVACRDRSTPLAPDTIPPVFTVQSPIDTVYDLDGDGFLDLSITWQDAGGAVNTSGVVVRSLEGVNGPASAGSNLLTVWRIETRNQQSVVLHETVENLLHGGTNRLEVRIPDTAGNTLIDTIAFPLPHGKFLKTIVSGLSTSLGRGLGISFCEDDRVVYMTVGRRIVIADADSLRLVDVSLNPNAFDDQRQVLCIPGEPVLYVAQRVERFHRPTKTWLPAVGGSFWTSSIALSRSDPNRLYVGEANAGSIGVINRAQNARVGSLIPFDSNGQEMAFDIAVLANDAKLYATRYKQPAGLLVVDPRTGETLKHVRISGGAWPDSGTAFSIALSKDDRNLYIGVWAGDPPALAVLDTDTDSVLRHVVLPAYVPYNLKVSPSGDRLFVTTEDRFPSYPSKNVLLSLPSLTVLQEFDRPRAPGVLRVDGAIAFHSTGKLVFVGHDTDIDVYLIRE